MALVEDAWLGNLKLPVVPRVILELVHQLKDDRVSMHQLANLIEQDPILASRTLQLANSPYYGNGRSLGSIREATMMLGCEGIRRIVMKVGLSSAFVGVPGVDLRQFWLDAAITASTARTLACLSRTTVELDEAAYLAGLLHATGHLVLCASFPVQARASFEHKPGLRGVERARAEQAAFGLEHPHVGATWARSLGLPDVVVNGIGHHLQPAEVHAGVLAPILHVATDVTTAIGRGATAREAVEAIEARLPLHLRTDAPHLGATLRRIYDALSRIPAPH
jgi:HD-like signal output (HDOD) protein